MLVGLGRLRTFIGMARSKDFSGTTGLLFLARPAIDTRVSSLRGRLSSQLFIEGAGRMGLSRRKGRLCRCTHRVIRLRGRVRRMFSGSTRHRRGYVAVTASAVPTRRILPTVLTGFERACPSRRFQVSRGSDYNIIRRMTKRVMSVKFANAMLRGGRYECVPFCRSRLIIVVPGARFCRRVRGHCGATA